MSVSTPIRWTLVHPPHSSEWRWVFELSTGWTAEVSDRGSEPTRYHVAAYNATRRIPGRGPFEKLDVAKREALDLAIMQEM